jgi:hypothetical protein
MKTMFGALDALCPSREPRPDAIAIVPSVLSRSNARRVTVSGGFISTPSFERTESRPSRCNSVSPTPLGRKSLGAIKGRAARSTWLVMRVSQLSLFIECLNTELATCNWKEADSGWFVHSVRASRVTGKSEGRSDWNALCFTHSQPSVYTGCGTYSSSSSMP